MNVFLACFLAVLFAKVVGHVAQHQIMTFFVRWQAKRAGARFVRGTAHGTVPTPVPMMNTPHGPVELPNVEVHMLQHDLLFNALELGERVAGIMDTVPKGESRSVDFAQIDPQHKVMQDLIGTSMQLWRQMPPSFIAHVRRMKAELEADRAQTEAAEDGRAA